jgi:hypothetical protein
MNFLQGINSLLQLDVIRGKLCLEVALDQHLSQGNIRAAKGTLSSACPSCSLTYCWVRAANGVKEELWNNGQQCASRENL